MGSGLTRYLAGVASALLLVAAGFFLWRALARDGTAPALPQPLAQVAAAGPEAPTAADAPQATEATREEKRFHRYDHDRDGKVSREEYLAARRKAFARLDLNHDGVLQFDEYAAKAGAKFAGADADKSGALDAAEFATTRVVRKAKPRCPPAQATSPARDDADEG
ncbi:EF-hand domain-containing protein [Sphingomonas sp.]|uniref:EF-hand domain-containing protein n=1 Tax=Sphingomonas sp. TaxID=28214 RepID=UPI003B009BEE